MIKIRINLDPTAEKSLSGVGNYAVRLAEALNNHPGVQASGFYFNFRGHRPLPKIQRLQYSTLNFPLKIYAKLDSFGIKIPFDFFLPPVDATIFPNFATWSTVGSKLKIVTIHDLTHNYFPDFVEAKNLAHLNRVVPYSAQKADLILAVSQTVKNDLVKELSINPDKILALPIPPSEAFLNPEIIDIKQRFKLPTADYILFVGNFEPRKNLRVLVEGYSKLPQAIKDKYTLVIAGSNGWNNQPVQDAIDQANRQSHNIYQIGGVDQSMVASLMKQATVLVMPSLYEGFGMPIVEAMTVGTPVIASDIPVLHESSGEAALFFNPKSAAHLAQQIQRLLADTKLQSDLIAKGQSYVKTLSWSKNADLIYQKIISLLN